MVEPMKQYHFEREKFCDAFTHTFGENDTIDFIAKWQEKCHIFSVAYELPHLIVINNVLKNYYTN